MLNIYLKHMLHNSIGGTKEVHTRDASHLCLHSARRQVLLSEAWNHVHHVQRGRGHVRVTQRAVTVQRRRRRRNMYRGQTLLNLFNCQVPLAQRGDGTQAGLLDYWPNTLGGNTSTQYLFSHSAPLV